MTAYFDKAGELRSFEGSPVFLNRSIPEDPEIKALLQPYKEELHQIVNEVVGFAADDMEMDTCAYQECALGNFFAEAFLNISHDLHPTSLPSISFLQRSMMRSSLQKGDITKGSIINMSPFTNRLVTFVVSGVHIVEAMERSVMFPWRSNPYTGPYTPHFSGVKATINTTSHEVLEILFKVGDHYEEFDVNRDYQVTTLDFLTRGGNGFAMFKEHGRNMTVLGVDRDILEKYVRKASPIVPHLDKRLTLVS